LNGECNLANENTYGFLSPDTGSSCAARLAGGFLNQPHRRQQTAGATPGAQKDLARQAVRKQCDRFWILCEACALVFCGRTSGFRRRAQQALRVQAATPRTIVLPQKAVAGAAATLAVLDTAGRMLPMPWWNSPAARRSLPMPRAGRYSTVPSEPGVLAARDSGP